MNKRRCSAITASGERCRKAALDALDVCAIHAGAKVGRPSLLTQETADRIVALLRAGNYVHTTVAAVGIGHRTFNDWMLRGASERPEDEPYRLLRERVEETRSAAEIDSVALISRAAAGDWRAAAWLLEREHPQRWGPREPRVRERRTSTIVETSDPFADVDDRGERVPT